MTLEEFKKNAQENEEWAPGWEAIDNCLEALYHGQKPRHFASLMPDTRGQACCVRARSLHYRTTCHCVVNMLNLCPSVIRLHIVIYIITCYNDVDNSFLR